MSWESYPTRTWSLAKYVDLRSRPGTTILPPSLCVNFYREQRLLTVVSGSSIVERVFLHNGQLSVTYRDAAVVFSSYQASQNVKFRIRFTGVADRLAFNLVMSEFLAVQESLPVQTSSQADSNVFSQPKPNVNQCLSQPITSSYMDLSHSRSSASSMSIKTLYESDTPSGFSTSSQVFPGYTQEAMPPFACSQQSAASTTTQPSSSHFRALHKDAETQTEPLDVLPTSTEEIHRALYQLLRDPSFRSLVERTQQVLPHIKSFSDNRSSFN